MNSLQPEAADQYTFTHKGHNSSYNSSCVSRAALLMALPHGAQNPNPLLLLHRNIFSFNKDIAMHKRDLVGLMSSMGQAVSKQH